MMKTQRIVIALTVINLALLTFQITQGYRAEAQPQSVAPVLRGQALEIVDSQGRVRASLKLQPAEPTAKPSDDKPAVESVIFRLVDSNGRPAVKLGASERSAGLALIGESDSSYVVLKAEGADSSLKLTSKNGREQIIKP